MMYGLDHFGMGLGMTLVWILVWVVPLVLIVLLFRRSFFFDDRGARRGKTALEILEERYARGEIEQGEYLKRRADLGG